MPKVGIRFIFRDKIITYICDDNLLSLISLITSFVVSTTIRLSIKKKLLKRKQILESEQILESGHILEKIKSLLRKILITLSVLLIERKRIKENKKTLKFYQPQNGEKLNQLRGGDKITDCIDPSSSYEVLDDGIATVIKDIIVHDWQRRTTVILITGPVFIVGAMAKKLLQQNVLSGSKHLTNLALFGGQVMFEDMKATIIKIIFSSLIGTAPLIWQQLVPLIPVLQGFPVLANFLNLANVAAFLLAATIGYTALNGITGGYKCSNIVRELPTFEKVADSVKPPFYIDLPDPGKQKVIITADEGESRPTPIYMQDSKTEVSQTCQAKQGPVGSQKSVQVECRKTAQYVPLQQRTKTLDDLKKEPLVNEARDKSSSSIERYESHRQKIMNLRGK